VDILRIATAGSVDDGKSTLIGRLMYDSKSIFEDQLEAVQRASRDRGDEQPNLALLTDGLRAEREQGITIDVAYRYFSTPARKFIVADTPGHLQYTRNMVTGASTADLAIILVDATKGLVEQSRRHAFLASLLGVRHLVVCVNKMDLVGYDRAVFEEVRAEFASFAARLSTVDVTFIPISALRGDNVVSRSERMPWYQDASLLSHLEQVFVAADRNLVDARFPVQYVIRPQSSRFPSYRGYAGQVAGGVLRPGDELMHLPSGLTTRIAAIDGHKTQHETAFAPMSVALRFTDELDISRGDMMCRPHNSPAVGQEIDAMVCWLGDHPLRPGGGYTVKHTTRNVRARVRGVQYRLDVNTLHRDEDANELGRNDIGRVRLRTVRPLFADPYARNRLTGAFIVIDETTNNTVGLGLINQVG
jgi:sulfate adenylyltransferase subunit 1